MKEKQHPATDSSSSARGPAKQKARAIEAQDEKLRSRLERIHHTVLVLSGKGGVGKSVVAANLAVALQLRGVRVGLLDADVHGPSLPTLFNKEGSAAAGDGTSIQPGLYGDGRDNRPPLKLMSIGFLLQDRTEAVIWRGPLKMNVLRQFLSDVEWGELDFLVVDLPPGTGDEPLSICQLIPDATGAVVVTTPQQLAISDVEKCITFCHKLNLPVLGVIENMSGLLCPHCGKNINVFGDGGGEAMARRMGVPFLGSVPMDPAIVKASDEGMPFMEFYPDSHAAKAFKVAISPILALAGR